jgi:ribosome-associated toxin RatA of RatAB toxin-antitoxin module
MRIPIRRFLPIMIVLIFTPATVWAQSAPDLLAEGPIAQVRYDAAGKFKEAVGITFIKASPEKVWEVMTDLERYVEFMPQLVDMKVISRVGNVVETSQEVEVPIRNARYTIRNELDNENHKMKITFVKGSIKGGNWSYELKPLNDGTLIYYHCNTILPGYVTTLEDESKTMTIGVNVATAVAVVKAFKNTVEKGYPPKKEEK